ncbi:MAG: right-handed parallel beta-helix repeat-containing protein [Candidatus Micrarchaeia archaeon]
MESITRKNIVLAILLAMMLVFASIAVIGAGVLALSANKSAYEVDATALTLQETKSTNIQIEQKNIQLADENSLGKQESALAEKKDVAKTTTTLQTQPSNTKETTTSTTKTNSGSSKSGGGSSSGSSYSGSTGASGSSGSSSSGSSGSSSTTTDGIISIGSASELTQAGKTYRLSGDIAGTNTDGSALKVTANDITIDGNGHEIFGYLDLSGVSGISVKNLILDPEYGVVVNNTNNSYFENDTFVNITNKGVWILGNSNNNRFVNTSISTIGSGVAYYIEQGSNNNSIDCKNALLNGSNASSTYAVYSAGANTTVKNCRIRNFATGIYIDTDSADYAQITGNNVDITYQTSCAYNSNNCHAVYIRNADIANVSNNVLNANGFALSTFHSDAGTIEGNVINAEYSAVSIYAGNDNRINANNFFAPTNTALKIWGFGQNNEIYDNIISATSNTALYLDNAINNEVYENVISAQTAALMLGTAGANYIFANNISADILGVYIVTGSNANTFEKNKINAGLVGINMVGDVDSNIFRNNTIIGGANTTAISIDSADCNSNKIYYNNISANIWVNDSGTNNEFNTTGAGNIYYFANTTSSWSVYEIYDSGTDNWADTGADRPFNAINVAGRWIGNGADWHPYAIAQVVPPTPTYVNLSDCAVLNQTNMTYHLVQNISTNAYVCFDIRANNVTLEGNGFEVQGNNPNTYSIAVYSGSVSKPNVKNISIRGYDYGVYLNGTNNANVMNSNVATRLSAVSLKYGTDNKVESNVLYSSERSAIYVYESNYTSVYFNNASVAFGADGSALYSTGSSESDIYGNHLHSSQTLQNPALFLDTGSDENTVNENKIFGYADSPAVSIEQSSGNTVYDNAIYSQNAEALLVRYDANKNTLENNNISGLYGVYIQEADENNVIGNRINGTMSAAVVKYGNDNKLESNVFYALNRSAIYIYESNYTSIYFNDASVASGADGSGLYMTVSTHTGIVENRIGSSDIQPTVLFDIDCNENTIQGNNISASAGSTAIYLDQSMNNQIYDNQIQAGAGAYDLYLAMYSDANSVFENWFNGNAVYIYNEGSDNLFGVPGSLAIGNYYANIDTLAIVDSNSDGYGDSGSAYPYNQANSGGKWIGAGEDLGPKMSP